MKPRNEGHSAPLSRRRFLTITAAAASLPALPVLAAKPPKKVTWEGRALGAHAKITLHTDDAAHAGATIQAMMVGVRRLEHYFSLFDKSSLINRLNQNGVLENPPREFFDLISEALRVAHLSGGRFDPTVQPLFTAYKSCAEERVPHPWSGDPRVARARKLVGWENVEMNARRVVFARPGMALTLNGIAQGYVTDRATDLLKDAGYSQTLVNFGEYSAQAPAPGRDGWRIALGQGQNRPVWSIKNSALAASERIGYFFDNARAVHHLLDPKSGQSANHWREIYVNAPSAMMADAASTALFATAPADISRVFNALDITRAYLVRSDGRPLDLIRSVAH